MRTGIQRPRTPRGEGDRTRDEILEATDRLLSETGSDDAVSIRAVADAIGVTPPAIYRHFTDKQALLFEVSARHFERMDRFIVAAGEGIDDPVEALAHRARAYVRFGVENPEAYRIMFMGRSDMTPEQYADEMLVDTSAFFHLVQCVGRCIDAGRFRPDLTDPHAVACTLWAAVHGLTSLLVAKPCMPAPPLDDRLEQMLGVLFGGVLRP